MRFGIFTAVENAAVAKQTGWAYVEEHVQNLLQADVSDQQWTGAAAVRKAPLPVPAAACLLPPSMKMTGPDASIERLQPYMRIILRRAQQVGIRTIVIGSGAARAVPDGWSRQTARRQIVEFCRMSAEIAAAHDVILVAEHLNRGECNIINSLPEAISYVRDVNHPNFQCLVDSFHFWLEDEKLEDLEAAMPWIRHVHLSDPEGRVPCGQSGKQDYRPLFRVLKRNEYNGDLTMEVFGFTDFAGAGVRALAFLKREWEEA